MQRNGHRKTLALGVIMVGMLCLCQSAAAASLHSWFNNLGWVGQRLVYFVNHRVFYGNTLTDPFVSPSGGVYNPLLMITAAPDNNFTSAGPKRVTGAFAPGARYQVTSGVVGPWTYYQFTGVPDVFQSIPPGTPVQLGVIGRPNTIKCVYVQADGTIPDLAIRLPNASGLWEVAIDIGTGPVTCPVDEWLNGRPRDEQIVAEIQIR